MTTFEVGWIMGLVTGVPAGIMGLLTYQWWQEYRTWHRRDEMDATIERLKALDRYSQRLP